MNPLLFLLPFSPIVLSQFITPLETLAWTVSSPALNISILGSYPSQAHLDLYSAGVIDDPYKGLNDVDLRWVGENNWTYSAILSNLENEAASTWLLFQGLDTFTTINLCDRTLAATNNQFRQYYFEVSEIIHSCKNVEPMLHLNFGSARKIVNDIANQAGQETWPFGLEQVFEFPNRQFMRKEQSDFGWDWGPAMSPAGPWLPAYLVQLNHTEIYPRNTLVDVYRLDQRNNRIPDQKQPWVLNCSIDYLGLLPPDASLRYALTSSSGDNIAHGALNNVTTLSGSITGSIKIEDTRIKLWWPHGLGPQHLYNLTLFIDSSSNNATLAKVHKRIGFRTIVLNEEPISTEQLALGIAPGNNWHFEINGHEFFAKGSNFIPPDAFWPRVTETKMRGLFDAVIAANQNMLRVWSSGAYSPDFLYEIADELGILMWSEFEFGDSLYPVDREFLSNVYEEAVYQVRRTNHHPSMAFWAGGNELENLELANLNTTGSEEDYVRYKNEYETLFLSTIFPAVFENTRSISYSPSSTSNGFISLNFKNAPYMQERYENLEKGSIYGETELPDYYNYNSLQAFNTSSYPIGRFSNEFGFHSMPSLQTWQQVINASDLHFNSSVILSRNHHYPPGTPNPTTTHNSTLGMVEMTLAAQRWFPTPMKTNPIANFSSWCHTTQLFQAAYYVSQIAFYRRGAALPQRTLGSLYWQLEDIWQAPTWAGIEYDGRWKVLHYRGKDIYERIVGYPFWDAKMNEVQVWIMSDLWKEAQARAYVRWFRWDGTELGVAGLKGGEAKIGGLNASMVFEGNATRLLEEAGYDAQDVVLRVDVSARGYLPNKELLQTFRHESWTGVTPLSRARLVDPGLEMRYDGVEDVFLVRATRGVAAWVWLDYPKGTIVEFDDNGFWLGRSEERKIGFRVKRDDTDGRWRRGVTIQSLWNNTLAE